jgi:arylsulfatase A
VTTTRRGFLAGAGSAAVASAVQSATTTKRPNFVFVLLDDLGWRDFGCYGSSFNETPNLDGLAADGARFTNAYAACPVCSPTRASILTGRYPVRFGMTDWIPGRTEPSRAVLQPTTRQELPLEETTIAELLKPFGYRTASIGKWHLGGQGFEPSQQGFDVNVAGTFRGHPQSYFGPFELPELNGGTKEDYLTDRLTDAAEQFIEQNANRAPFLLYLPEFAVHLPMQARDELAAKYRRKNGGKEFPNPVYAAMLESVDQAIGRLRRKLKQTGVAENTVFIVTSDNGGVTHPRITDNSPLRAGKGHLYEGGIREPLIVAWPGFTKPGRTVHHPVTSVDYLPTLLELAGAPIQKGIDGVSFASVLRGRSLAEHRPLFWHYPHYSPQGGEPAGAVRWGDWKLIEFFGDGRSELFNVKDDPGERRNLVQSQTATANKLREMLRAWRATVGASVPLANPDGPGPQDWPGRERPVPPV